MLDIIQVHGSWLMTGRNLGSIAALNGPKFEDIGGAGASAATNKWGVGWLVVEW